MAIGMPRTVRSRSSGPAAMDLPYKASGTATFRAGPSRIALACVRGPGGHRMLAGSIDRERICDRALSRTKSQIGGKIGDTSTRRFSSGASSDSARRARGGGIAPAGSRSVWAKISMNEFPARPYSVPLGRRRLTRDPASAATGAGTVSRVGRRVSLVGPDVISESHRRHRGARAKLLAPG